MEKFLENGVKIKYTGSVITIDSSEFSGKDQELKAFIKSVELFLRNYGITRDGDASAYFSRPGQSIMASRKPSYFSYTGEDQQMAKAVKTLWEKLG